MWNPFRRKQSEELFPKPKWPPIQDLNGIDLTGQRQDGGVDLIVVASQPIDDSPETLESIRHKVWAYLSVVDTEEFQAEMSHPPRDKTAIIVVCEHPIHPKALIVLGQCSAESAVRGIRLEVRKSIDSLPISLPAGGNEAVQSIRPVTLTDRNRLAAHSAAVLKMLRTRYGNVHLRRTEDDLQLLQRLHDDGGLDATQGRELEAIGIVFGDVLAARTSLDWITVEWKGKRDLGLQYPDTTIIVFPGSMIAKRINRGEQLEFEPLFRATVAQVEEMKDDPEYRQ
jgi:hypothetical protein